MARDRGEFMPRQQILLYPATNNDHTENSPFESVRTNGTDYLLTSKRMVDYMKLYRSGDDDLQNPYYAPLVSKDLSRQPRTLIITAEYDPLRDEGEAYGIKLAQAGNDVEIHRIHDALHGFMSLSPGFKPVKKTYQYINAFLSGKEGGFGQVLSETFGDTRGQSGDSQIPIKIRQIKIKRGEGACAISHPIGQGWITQPKFFRPPATSRTPRSSALPASSMSGWSRTFCSRPPKRHWRPFPSSAACSSTGCSGTTWKRPSWCRWWSRNTARPAGRSMTPAAAIYCLRSPAGANRINLEVYHSLTDGTGALQFLKTLVCNYLAIKYPQLLPDLLPEIEYDASTAERDEDSF